MGTALLKRWEKNPSAVMVTTKNNQYTIKNARRKREPMELVLIITKTVKTRNIPVFKQVILINTGIKLKFRRDFLKPRRLQWIHVLKSIKK